MAELSASIELKGIDHLSGVARRTAANFRRFAKNIQEQNKGLSKSFARIRKQNAGLIKGVKRLGLVTSGLAVAGFYKTVRAGSDFQSSLADLSAITGVVGKDLELLKEKSLAFSRESVMPATEVAEAFKLVASAKSELLQDLDGFSEVTKQVILLSNASGLALPAATNVATQAMNQFSLGAKDASRAVNVLAAGSKIGASEVPETGQALIEAGVSARDAKVSFEETNAAIQVLAKGGLKATRAGTALKNIFVRLETQSNRKFKPSVVGLSQALASLGKANLDAEEKSKLFGMEALAAGSILIREKMTFDKFNKGITGTSIAQEQAAIRLGTFQKRVEKFGITLKTFMIRVFDRLKPKLTSIMQRMQRMLEAFDEVKLKAFTKKVSRLIDRIDGLIQSLGGLKGIWEKAKLAFIFFGTFKVSQSLLTLAPTLAAIAKGAGGISGASTGAAAAVGGLSMAFTGLAAAVGALSFTATFYSLRRLSRESKLARKSIRWISAGIVPGFEAYRSFQDLRRKISGLFARRKQKKAIQRIDDEKAFASVEELNKFGEPNFSPVQEDFSPIKNKGPDIARLSSLIKEINAQQQILKKPQKVEMLVKVQADSPARVAGLQTSPNVDLKANMGQIIP